MAFGSEKRRELREQRAEARLEEIANSARDARERGQALYFYRGGLVESDREVAELLGAIESAGWRLESAGYAFVPSISTSTGLGGIESTDYSGAVQGSFIFRPDDSTQRPSV